jgi:hypothetical protein
MRYQIRNCRSLVLLFCTLTALKGQTAQDGFRDTMQRNADYLLKGLASIEVCPIPAPGDLVKRYSSGSITASSLYSEVAKILNTYHLPSVQVNQPCKIKDNVGSVWLLGRVIPSGDSFWN